MSWLAERFWIAEATAVAGSGGAWDKEFYRTPFGSSEKFLSGVMKAQELENQIPFITEAIGLS